MRRATAARVVGGTIAGIALLFALGVFVLTRTDWGRERIRVIAVDRLADQVAGRVTVERISGNLLSGATLENVTITDSAGAPFLAADTISLRYSLRSLLADELFFSDIRLVRPHIVLDRPPGGRWNFERLFPRDTSAVPDTTPGFGSWVRLEDMVIVDGTVIVRQPWQPPEGRAIPVASGIAEDANGSPPPNGDRIRVVPAPGGYQSVWEFRELDAELPFVRFADPDSATRRIDVASLSMTALPFHPPAARVRDLSGTFLIGKDTVSFRDIRLELPATRLVGEGVFAIDGSGALRGGGRADQVALEDLRWLRPSLPAGGGAIGSAAVVRTDDVLRLELAGIDLRVQGAHLAGGLDVQLGTTIRFGPSTLAFVDVSTDLLENLAPSLAPPVPGSMNGHLRLVGAPAALDVAGRIAFTPTDGRTSIVRADGGIGTAAEGLLLRNLNLRLEPLYGELVAALKPSLPADGRITGVATLNGSTATGLDIDARLAHIEGSAPPSHILAAGRIDLRDGATARNLRLRFDPLQVALLRRMAPDLPVDGVITGRATINGSRDIVRAVLDIEHRAPTGTSRVVGNAVYEPAPSRFRLDLRLPVLALPTVGRFAPAVGLEGTASGRIDASGTPADFMVDADLAANGGHVEVEGRLQLEGPADAYDLTGRVVAFDAAAVSARAPTSDLTGTFAVRGRGTDLATATAIVRADMASAAVDGTRVDSTHLLVRVADGMATAERAHIRIASATAELEGSFGLVAGRSGELAYRIGIDSLSDFRGYVPADTGMVSPRPLVRSRTLASARADSIRSARDSEVQRMAVGYPPAPGLEPDSLPPIPRDSMAGTVRAEGVIAGNLKHFDVRGTAAAERVVARGSYLAAAEAEYALIGYGQPDASLQVDASADSLRIDGFAFDSIGLDVDYTGLRQTGTGTAELSVFQDPDRDYRIAAEFELALERNLARLTDVALRFDSTHWSSTRTGVIEWGSRGVAVRTIELESETGGRVFVDGLLPIEDAADLRVELDRLQVAHVVGLLQDSVNVRGLLTLDARVTGTRASPRFEGDIHLVEAALRERELPALDAALSYSDQVLTGDAVLTADSIRLLTAEARVPIDLALERPAGPRLLDRPLTGSVQADSLPLEALPSFTEALADVRGRLRGDVAIAGTTTEPDLSGKVDLDLASLRIVSPGIALTDIAGTLQLADDIATIDSLVAYSGGGEIRVSGLLGLETLTRPSFDMTATADNAIVLNSARGRLRADLDLTAEGPYDGVLVSGDVYVRSGVIQAPETDKRRVTNLDDPAVLQGLSTADTPPELLPQPDPLLDNLRLDIALRVARDTWVRNSDGNVEIYTPEDADPVLIEWHRGTGTMALEGVINADRGEYSYAGHSFDLTTGSVSFLASAPMDPLLQLTAQKEVRRSGRESLIIQIHVLGTLSEPRVALESNAQPPLPESDLLAYLAFGRSSSSLLDLNASGASGGDDLGALGALAQQQLGGLGLGAALDQAFSDIEREGTRAGLDVFRIRTAQLPAELAFDSYFANLVRGTELEAGMYFERRLFVAAEMRAASALPGVRIEYRHATGFTWEAVWEPHYFPTVPSLSADVTPTRTRTLGTFLRWSRRF